MAILKICVLAIIFSVLAVLIGREKKEWEILVILLAGIFLFQLCVSRIGTIIEFLKSLWENLPVEQSLFLPLIKMLGISYAAEFASSLCAEAGQNTIGNQIELFAKLSIVVLSLPGLAYLLQMMEEVL